MMVWDPALNRPWKLITSIYKVLGGVTCWNFHPLYALELWENMMGEMKLLRISFISPGHFGWKEVCHFFWSLFYIVILFAWYIPNTVSVVALRWVVIVWDPALNLPWKLITYIYKVSGGITCWDFHPLYALELWENMMGEMQLILNIFILP